jgi:flagellar FliL protein
MKMMSYIIIASLVAFIVSGGVVYYMTNIYGQSNLDKMKNHSLGKFTVNIVDNDSYREKYIKTQIKFSTYKPDLKEDLNKKLPQIRDSIVEILRVNSKQLPYEEDFTGLKKEIKNEVDKYLNNAVHEIYITSFVTT